jgi:hypothetical protein
VAFHKEVWILLGLNWDGRITPGFQRGYSEGAALQPDPYGRQKR